MKLKHPTSIIAAALALCSCGGNQQKDSDPVADTGRTQRTENLLASLKALTDSCAYLFGHHDDTVYGIGWEADYTNDSTIHQRSDVKSVCNDYPALLSFDLGHLELGEDKNLDGVPFSRIRQEIIAHYDRGGMITLSWHLNNPLTGNSSWVDDNEKDSCVTSVLEGGANHQLLLSWLDRVADFLNSLETPYGVKVPVLFRPWHEHTGSWFWWGQLHCSADEYKALWRLTADRLRQKGVTNTLYAYSPGTEPDGDETKYMERYPGDDIIDLMGLDSYCFAPDGDTTQISNYATQLDKNLAMVCRLAHQHQKAAALTETGFEGIQSDHWWTKTLAPVLARHPISYVLVWRNAHNLPGHFFAPYPGHPSSADFVGFYNQPSTLFLKDVNALYLPR